MTFYFDTSTIFTVFFPKSQYLHFKNISISSYFHNHNVFVFDKKKAFVMFHRLKNFMPEMVVHILPNKVFDHPLITSSLSS